ncbi:4Fe-4S dicluster domain-containing protein [Geomonas sp. RF6]|uniref:heterodisulfide reductase-related iron-sulfur binding cluster n=1 Tax=Geomonas sp. RF6 TaxID=2897342 RepID=UPI001E402828|nr:heterodisulfide reductase-related iron-sulfur binding cluster [Geomonas sp. RF6]UFS70022.1 4Fe-4S dicluster domain-containing protein [Geomonas sp. RF6]
MEASRQIYWNVGLGVLLPMYFFTALTFAAVVFGFYRRVQVYKLGKPLHRRDQIPRRISIFLKNVFTQLQVLRVPGPGSLHAFFFWGFFLLFIGTLLIMIQVDFSQPLFGLRFLRGTFYEIYSLTLDIAGGLAILMLGGLLVRRFVVKPHGLDTVWDDYFMHALIFSILITGFIVEALRMAVTEIGVNPDLARFSPVGLLAGYAFVGIAPRSLAFAHKVLWWVHFFLSMTFIAAIPLTKLRHLFTTSVNYFFSDLTPKGTIVTPNLEDETVDQYGALKVPDLPWKYIYDSDACTVCKRCQDRCPAYNTDKPLTPMQVVRQVGEMAFNDPQGDMVRRVTEEVLWECTTCRACQEICPAGIEHVNIIMEMRRELALMEGAFPGEEVRSAVGHLEVNGNPFGLAYASRGDWAQGLDVKVMAEERDVDILYFAGCFASFDRRNKEVAKNFLRICNAAGVRVGILGKEEKCCGDPVRRLGNEYLYQMLARENIELFQGYGVKKIVTTCPHCFNTLRRDYRDLGLEKEVEVEHYSRFMHTLLRDRRLTLRPEAFDLTYHDSCYVGRYMDIIDEPRELLKACGGGIREMGASRYESFCCGSGGGRILAEERVGTRINEKRVGMAHGTGAPMLVSNCPYCLSTFEDGIKTGGFEGKIVVKDLAEIVASRLGTPTPPATPPKA